MLVRILAVIMLPFIFLGGDGTTTLNPVPLPYSGKEEVVLYQTDELSIKATDFTYATSVMFNYTITNKTNKSLKFSLPNTTLAGSEYNEPLQCTLRAGTTSKSLVYTQPESTFKEKLKFAISDYDEYSLVFLKVGKIVTIDLQSTEDTLYLADLVYDGNARVYKTREAVYIDNPPLGNTL